MNVGDSPTPKPFTSTLSLVLLSLSIATQSGCSDDAVSDAGDSESETAETETEAGDGDGDPGDGDPGDGDPGDGDPGDGDPGDGDPGDGDPGDGDPGDGDGDPGDGDGDPGDGDPGDGDGDPSECVEDVDCASLDGPCEQGVCNMGTCEAQTLADDTPCSSGDLCLVDEVCTAGVCGGGGPVDCTMIDDDCNMGVCDPNNGQCAPMAINDNGPCDDGDMCTMDTVCTAGACGGGMEPDCSSFDDDCNVGACDPNSGQCGPMPANDNMPCDDAEPCTYDDVCSAGACLGISDPIFVDDFSGNMGWTTEGDWEIGAAAASPNGTISGLPDPDVDHTATNDEMLAGWDIGGLSGPPGHAPQYLISPVIDLSVLDPNATVELRYWRWLVNTVAFMSDTIDVWDGNQWVNVFTSTGNTDQAWTEVAFDVSAYDNADFQVRFGHAYSNFMVGPAEPSWSVDDVEVAPVCP